LLEEISELKSSEFMDKEGIIEGGIMKRLVLTSEEEKKGAFLFASIVFIRPWCYEPHRILVLVREDWRKESQSILTTHRILVLVRGDWRKKSQSILTTQDFGPG
jgi:hypothetical protein